MDDANSNHSRRLIDLIDSFDFVQSVSGPTHTGGHTLDLIITRSEEAPKQCVVDPPIHSDHGLIKCSFGKLTFNVFQSRTANLRCWKKLDRSVFKDKLASSTLCKDIETHSSKTVEELFELYDSTLRQLVNESLPVKSVKIKDRPLTPWYDGECRAARRRVRLWERRYRRTDSATDCQQWVRQLEKKRDLLQRKEAAYWNAKIVSNGESSKKLWKCVNNIMMRDSSNKSTPPVTITADSMSKYFTDKVNSVRDKTVGADEPTYTSLTTQTMADFNSVTQDDVRKIILESPSKSSSLDPIPTFLLREYLDDLLPFIWSMCCASLDKGQLPKSQKAALITPIVKKSGLDPNDVKSYRPISNLTFISKVIERIVASQLTAYLNKYELIPPTQSAYRKGHSTETAVLKIFSDIINAGDEGKVTLLGMLDLSAAFDTVDGDILLERLRLSYGLDGLVLRWLESFVSDRSQAVVFGGQTSATMPLLFGVPQGSVLGPLLFLLYTADVSAIASSMDICVHSYADDIQLYIHSLAVGETEATDRLARCIVRIERWMAANRLCLNTDKTQVMWLGSRQQLTKITTDKINIGGTEISLSSTAKILGIVFDRELSLKPHINSVTKSCFYQLRQIRTIRRLLTADAAKALIHAFITSRIDYCNGIYVGSTDWVFSKLQSVMNAAARLITGSLRRDHITPVLRDLHWLPIRRRVNFKLVTLVYGCLRGEKPVYLSEDITPVSTNIRRAGLRSSQRGQLMVPRTKTSRLGQRSFRVAAPAIWNALPQQLSDFTMNPETYRKNLKTFLFSQCYR